MKSSKLMLSVATACVLAGMGVVDAQYAQPQPAPPAPQQYPPQYGTYAQPNPQANAQAALAQQEIQTELKKAQIQSTLADKIAQIKGDQANALKAKADADPNAVLDAQVDAVTARSGADIARLNVQSLDIQSRNPQPPQTFSQPNYAPPVQVQQQLLQIELKKAQVQSAAAAQVASLKQQQFDMIDAKVKTGAAPLDRRNDALIDLESAKAAADIAKLDEGMMAARLTAMGGAPMR